MFEEILQLSKLCCAKPGGLGPDLSELDTPESDFLFLLSASLPSSLLLSTIFSASSVSDLPFRLVVLKDNC